MEQTPELEEAIAQNTKQLQGLTQFEEGFIQALDPYDLLMKTLYDIKKSNKMLKEAKIKCQELSAPNDYDKGMIAVLESRNNYYDIITLEDKRKIAEQAFDMFCTIHGINYSYQARVLPYDDDDLNKIDNAAGVYKFAQDYAYKHKIHLMN